MVIETTSSLVILEAGFLQIFDLVRKAGCLESRAMGGMACGSGFHIKHC